MGKGQRGKKLEEVKQEKGKVEGGWLERGEIEREDDGGKMGEGRQVCRQGNRSDKRREGNGEKKQGKRERREEEKESERKREKDGLKLREASSKYVETLQDFPILSHLRYCFRHYFGGFHIYLSISTNSTDFYIYYINYKCF